MFVHREAVRFRDLDPMGHVNNAVFLTYIESARAAFLQHLGAVQTLEDLAIIVARIEIDFRAPVRFGDEVEVSVRVQPLRRQELRPRARAARRRARSSPRRRRVLVTYDYETANAGRRSPRVAGEAGRMSVFERHQLDNGLRVLTADMPQVQSVTCMIMLAAGSRYETPDTNGIAHFAEHMFFKGTERRPTAREIGMEVDGLGGEFNAFTSKEYTGYYVKCAADYRDRALDVLVDMLRNSKFESEEIEREKGVIVEEMNMYYDTPRDFIGGVYDELLYGDQPLGWDIIGKKETVRAATRDTFLGYVDRWYKPERMVVGLGGRLEGDPLETVQRLLGDLEAQDTGAPPAVEVERDSEPQVTIHRKESDQAHLCLGVRSYPLDHPDRYALQLLSTVLGDRDVVAPLHRGARAARPRLLRLRPQPELHRRGLALLPGRGRHQPRRRGGRDDRAGVPADRRRDRALRTSSRRRARSPRDASCSGSRTRRG